MKKLILGLCVIGNLMFGVAAREVIFSGTNPMPSTYTAGNTQSMIASELLSVKHMRINNQGNWDMVCTIYNLPYNNAPSNNAVGVKSANFTVVSSESLYLRDINISRGNLWCHGDGASVTYGKLHFLAW